MGIDNAQGDARESTSETGVTLQPGHKLCLAAFASLLGLALLGHFLCTTLYLTPPNPIRIIFHNEIEEYMDPWFTQSWQLFAPTPAGTNYTVLVACKLGDGGTFAETEWFDITTPVRKKHYERRITPALLLARAQKPRLFLRADPMNADIRRSKADTPTMQAAKEALRERAARRFADGQVHLTRIASAACDRRFGMGRTIEVRAKFVIQRLLPFAEREANLSPEDAHSYEFPWAHYEYVHPY